MNDEDFPKGENPYVDSRYRKMKVPCPMCGNIMGERYGNHWWFLRYKHGQSAYMEQEHMQNTAVGIYKITCRVENCPGGSLFAWVKEDLRITEVADIAKIPVRIIAPVDAGSVVD